MHEPTPGAVIDSLASSMRHGLSGLERVPELVIQVCEHSLWREWVTKRGEPAGHKRFEDFVTTEPLKGLGTTVEALKRACRDSQDARNAIDAAMQRPAHRPTGTLDNIKGYADGTSTEQALRRLRKDRPDLHEAVLEERLSAHAAMVEAGFRPRTATVRLDDPEKIATTLRKRLSPEQLRQLAQLLTKDA